MYRKLFNMALMAAVVDQSNTGGTAVAGTKDSTVNVSDNPLAASITAQVDTKLVEMKDVKFNFRKDKDLEEKHKDNPKVKGQTKRPTFTSPVPLLTKLGVAAAMQSDDKSTALIVDLANEAIINRYRGLIADKIDGDGFDIEKGQWGISLVPGMFDMQQLAFHVIATLPKSERGAGISKEQWAAFTQDYVAVMQSDKAVALTPDHKKRTPDVLAKHAQILGGKFNAVRSRKDVIQQMLAFLDVWAQASENLEEHQECYEHLVSKGQLLLQAENFDDL